MRFFVGAAKRTNGNASVSDPKEESMMGAKVKTESDRKGARGRATRHPGVKKVTATTWRVRVYYRDPKTGREREIYRLVEARSADDAARRRLELKEQLAPPGAREPASCSTVGDLAAQWLRGREEQRRPDGTSRLTPATLARYEQSIQNWIVPFLGEFRADRLDRRVLEAYRDKLGTGLAAASVNGHLRVLRTLLRQTAGIELPVVRLEEDDTRITDDEPNLLEADELRRFLDAVRELQPQHYPLVLWLATTAQRISTALAMRWEDIDEAKGVAVARRRLSDGQVIAGVKRGRTSRDVVPVPPELLAVLKEHRASFNEAQERSGLLFPSETGGWRARSHLDAPMREALEAAGIGRRLTPHGLRRTASRLYRLVASEAVAMGVAGHLTVSMHRHYAPVGAAEKLEASERVLRLVRGGGDGPEPSGTGDRTGEIVEEAGDETGDGWDETGDRGAPRARRAR